MKTILIDPIFRVLNRRLYRRNDIIFEEGDLPGNAFIVIRGSVDIFKKSSGGNILINTVIGNQIFGELALIDDRPRSATAIAHESTELLVINKLQFQERVSKLDTFMKYWVGYLSDRIIDLTERCAE